MRYKVAELEGALLDAAVAKAEGWIKTRSRYDDTPWLWDTGGGFYRVEGPAGEPGNERWRPSTWWDHAGPIIERESLAVFRQEWSDGSLREWKAGSSHDLDEGPKCSGPTPLIAAMRAYVALKFGETVELP